MKEKMIVTSTNGTDFTLSNRDGHVYGSAKGIDMGLMEISGATLSASFMVKVGGKNVNISAELDARNAAATKSFFDSAGVELKEKVARDEEYDVLRDKVLATD